jgi:DNA modification methylase
MTDETKSLDALVADPANRRLHPARNVEMVRASLQQLGAARSIVIDEDDVILAGNGVTAAALAAGITSVRVIETSGDELVAVRRRGLTPEQKRALALFDNRTAELAEWDVDGLRADSDAGLDLQPFWTADEQSEMLTVTRGGKTDPDAVPEARATDIQRGDLFELGAHRLLCGSATAAADVARVMGDEQAALCLTDPPYSVNYDRSREQRGGSTTAHAPYHEADIDPTDLLAGFFAQLPTSVLVMSYPMDRHFAALASALTAAQLELRRELVWVKDRFSFWPSANYQQQHEPILICVRRGVALGGTVPANMSSVFEVPRPHAHDLHPTEKPLELWRVFVTNHAAPGGLVFDPFVGSGTTLMACEELSRACRAIEIEPQYCQVTIDRWEAFTGQKARKHGD